MARINLRAGFSQLAPDGFSLFRLRVGGRIAAPPFRCPDIGANRHIGALGRERLRNGKALAREATGYKRRTPRKSFHAVTP